MEKRKKQGGGARLKANGKSLIWVAPDAAQKRVIKLCAAEDNLPMSKLLLRLALEYATTRKVNGSPIQGARELLDEFMTTLPKED